MHCEGMRRHHEETTKFAPETMAKKQVRPFEKERPSWRRARDDSGSCATIVAEVQESWKATGLVASAGAGARGYVWSVCSICQPGPLKAGYYARRVQKRILRCCANLCPTLFVMILSSAASSDLLHFVVLPVCLYGFGRG